MKEIGKYFVYLCFVAIGILVASLFRCEPDPVLPDVRKEKINREIKKEKEVKKEIKKADSIRIVEVVRWRKMKADTVNLPCDSVIKKLVHICDTIILVDSVEISRLTALRSMDSLIISDQAALIKSDSITISKQAKKIKRLRFWGNAKALIAFGAGVVFSRL